MASEAKAIKIELPDAERGRGANDIRRLDRLLNRLTRQDLTAKQREAAMRELYALESAPKESADKAWRDRVNAETAELAKIRGEEVERAKSGTVTIRSRDPLMNLLRRGHLTAEQFDTATALRSAYEARAEGLGSQLGRIGGLGGAHNNNRFVMAHLNRAKALQRVATVERAILLSPLFRDNDCQSHIGLTMVREICGHGKSLSSQGEGRAFTANLKAFCIALDVVRGV